MCSAGSIMALDLATACGIAEGAPGARPRASSVSFKVKDGGLFGAGEKAHAFFLDRLAVDTPKTLFIEYPGLHGIASGRTSFEVIFRILGLIYLAGVAARTRGLSDVRLVRVAQIRKHFLGSGRISGATAKKLVQQRCRDLGWDFANPDEADALALWAYGCEQVCPGSGHVAAPNLFRDLTADLPAPKPRPVARIKAAAARKLLARPRGV